MVNEGRATATSATFRFLNPRNPPQPALAAPAAASENSHQFMKANPQVKRDLPTVIANVLDSSGAAVTFQKSELKFSSSCGSVTRNATFTSSIM